jgi:hypothetical protein
VKRDAAFRKGLLSEAVEGFLSGEVSVGKELLRDYINARVMVFRASLEFRQRFSGLLWHQLSVGGI